MRTLAVLIVALEFVYWCFCFATPMSIKNAALPDVPDQAAYTGTPGGFFASLSTAAL